LLIKFRELITITGKEEKGYINEKGEIILKIVESEF